MEASRQDVTNFIREAARNDILKSYLPTLNEITGADIPGEILNIHFFFEANLEIEDGTKTWVLYHPKFRRRGPRYDFVLQNHSDEYVQPNKYGNTPNTVTPSRLLVLYKNPLDE